MTRFIGRQLQLNDLKSLKKKKTSSLVVIRGRRRIGKSRLAEEFGKSFERVYTFSGLPPIQKTTASSQREEFSRQMKKLRVPQFSSNDWGDLFDDLAEHTKQGPVLIVLDEITWMGNLDATFLGKLKTAWDLHFKKNPNLIMILSGSNSYWIEQNILSSTGFLGRVSYRLVLNELPLHECNEFWNTSTNLIAPYEKFKILSVTGGVPRYLEEVHPELSAEENIKRLCYQKEGILFNEFDDIFSDIFAKRYERYKHIVQILANGPATLDQISKGLGRKKGGDLSATLEDLCEAGFLTRSYSWRLATSKVGKESRFRLSDNYVRFYLKYIEPYRHHIETNTMQGLPKGWLSIMGYQFENLVLNNLHRLFDILSIPLHEVLFAGPFFQKKTKRYSQCQIDLLIQRTFNTIYVCEIKFEQKKIKPKIIKEVQERINHLYVPRGYSIRPVLIHVNGVSDTVLDNGFFANIVDFSEWLSA